MKTTAARRKHAMHAAPCYKLAKLILEKLNEFDLDGLEHGYKIERADACERAKDCLKEALAALMEADGAYKANVMCEIEEMLEKK